MKRERLSFGVAATLVAFIFLCNYTFMKERHLAYASTSGISGAMLRGDSISNARKREIRLAVGANPEKLIDLPGNEILSILNQPELIRSDAPTTIWQYRNAACVLDVYFTTNDKQALHAPVVHYEIRSRAPGVAAGDDLRQRCVRDLVRMNAGVNMINISALYKAN